MKRLGIHAAGIEEERCHCGKLLAKATPRGIEILCHRCKGVHTIPWREPRRKGRRAEKDVLLLTG